MSGFRTDDKRRPFAAGRIVELSKRLGHLTVHLAPGVPADASLVIDGAPLDAKTLEQGIEVDPGKTVVVLKANGHAPRSYDVTLGVGETHDVVADFADAAAPPVSVAPATPPPTVVPEPPKSSSRGLQHTLGFVGVGVGGAGIVVGSIFGALALHEASVVKSQCPTLSCPQSGVNAASSGKTDTVVSTVGFIAGGVFAAAGIYFLATTWGPAKSDAPHAAGSLVLTPSLAPDGGGVSAALTF